MLGGKYHRFSIYSSSQSRLNIQNITTTITNLFYSSTYKYLKMKLTQFGLFAVGLQAYHVSASMRPDIKGAQVVELEPGQKVTADTKELPTTMGPDSDFEFLFRCPKDSGKVFAVTADNKYLTCCLPGQVLVGTAATELRCCGGGHDLAGSAAVGFSCCPTGQTYDGKVCKVATPPEPVCINGKALENGKCVCPSGTSEAAEGHCAPVKCSSGIKSGKLLRPCSSSL